MDLKNEDFSEYVIRRGKLINLEKFFKKLSDAERERFYEAAKNKKHSYKSSCKEYDYDYFWFKDDKGRDILMVVQSQIASWSFTQRDYCFIKFVHKMSRLEKSLVKTQRVSKEKKDLNRVKKLFGISD